MEWLKKATNKGWRGWVLIVVLGLTIAVVGTFADLSFPLFFTVCLALGVIVGLIERALPPRKH